MVVKLVLIYCGGQLGTCLLCRLNWYLLTVVDKLVLVYCDWLNWYLFTVVVNLVFVYCGG